MSSWTVLTVRGRRAEDYDYTRSDNHDRWDATADIVATMADDDRVRQSTTWSGHVYAYLDCESYEDEPVEEFLTDYAEMVDDAVVLYANDTTDCGKASYYPDPDGGWVDRYRETAERHVGERALAVMTARRGIVARDPFHNGCGRLKDNYLRDGVQR